MADLGSKPDNVESTPQSVQELRQWCQRQAARIASLEPDDPVGIPIHIWQEIWRLAGEFGAYQVTEAIAPPYGYIGFLERFVSKGPQQVMTHLARLIEWCDGRLLQSPPDSPPLDSDPVLSPLQYEILEALWRLKGTDAEKRKTASDIAKKVGGNATEQSCKSPLSDLKRRSLVDSKEGRGGGSWLTPKGLELIVQVREGKKL